MTVDNKDFITFDKWFELLLQTVRESCGFMVELNKQATFPYYEHGMNPRQAAVDIFLPVEERAWDGNNWRIV